ncbi:hypothetical protein [Shewanella morhuae]|uniref:hypothetical protein n=1 Tax=Shewanella morhuae TaxID=365591 RepID=UPI001BBA4815|nr:hypothetical protein [Shewanella morhuae]GIU07507.1 hypothetical protein TUM4641_20190 [Shewanella morhuae]
MAAIFSLATIQTEHKAGEDNPSRLKHNGALYTINSSKAQIFALDCAATEHLRQKRKRNEYRH